MQHRHRVTIDPWSSSANGALRLPQGALFLGTWGVNLAVDDIDEDLHLVRAAEVDTLWTTSWIGVGAVASMPTAATVDDAVDTLVDAFIRARCGFEWPTHFIKEGLLKRVRFEEIRDAIKAEIEAHRSAALADVDSPIVATARRLRLNPEPAGQGPHAWYANCPGGQHRLHVNSKKAAWGCGYCQRKGGIPELEAFVARPTRLRR